MGPVGPTIGTMKDLTDAQLAASVAALVKIINAENAGTKPRGFNAERKNELLAGPMAGWAFEDLHPVLYKVRGALRRSGRHSDVRGATTGIDKLAERIKRLSL